MYTYRQNVTFPSRPWLDDEDYRKFQAYSVRLCVDVALYTDCPFGIFLAKRKIDIKGWWTFGGMLHPGEDVNLACQRILGNDTGLLLPPEDFEYVCLARHIYGKTYPRDSITMVHAAKIVDCRDVEGISLDDTEYEGKGAWFRFGDVSNPARIAELHPGVTEITKAIMHKVIWR